jgi:hypothetical protein
VGDARWLESGSKPGENTTERAPWARLGGGFDLAPDAHVLFHLPPEREERTRPSGQWSVPLGGILE